MVILHGFKKNPRSSIGLEIRALLHVHSQDINSRLFLMNKKGLERVCLRQGTEVDTGMISDRNALSEACKNPSDVPLD